MHPLRSTSLLLAALALVAGAAACGSAAFDGGADASGGDTPGQTTIGGADSGAAPFAGGSADASVGNIATKDNPICNVVVGVGGYSCDPDSLAPPESSSCSIGDAGLSGSGPVTLDAGIDAGPSPIACHVALDPTTSTAAPACEPSGTGTNGAQCLGSTDCAAGFECVGSPGVCRRYCCGVPTSTCDTNFFCDIQSETSAGSVKIPVCEPVQPCQLMGGDAMCGSGETCGIVNDDDGTTSCLGVGPAAVGESCDYTHCKKDSVCLGEAGSKKCFALCDKTKPNCDSSQTCTGAAPLFQGVNAQVGVCQP